MSTPSRQPQSDAERNPIGDHKLAKENPKAKNVTTQQVIDLSVFRKAVNKQSMENIV